MVGNLVDNACKWANSRVSIEMLLEQPEPARQALRIVVDDDGPGLSPAQREQVARRGQRLDETKPGSGLGLSIVLELAGALRRRAQPRHRADRRLARRTGAAGGVRGYAAKRVFPLEAAKACEVAIGGAQCQTVLDRECGKMGIGDEIAAHSRAARAACQVFQRDVRLAGESIPARSSASLQFGATRSSSEARGQMRASLLQSEGTPAKYATVDPRERGRKVGG